MSNCKTIAVCNQKGGVGKTTTTVNLGVGLAMQGKKVLLIDADPQGDLTTCLGWRDTDSLSVTLTEKLQTIISEQEQNPFDGILQHKEKVDLVPSNLSLSSLEMTLVTAMSRESVLKNYLSLVKDKYDYVLIDCMPSLGMITFNTVYEIRAAEDVVTPDGTLRYSKGELVDTVTTDETGFAKSKELYLGKYEIKEVKAGYGMVLSSEVHTVELIYAGQNVAVTETATSFVNERQKVEVSLEKALETNELFGIGNNGEIKNISFGLFADEELVSASGTSIPKDGLLEIITLDENGRATVGTDLPLGSYYVKELATDEHYQLSGEKYPVVFEYAGQEAATVVIAVNDGEPMENRLIYGSVSGKKVDENGEGLGGALIGLFKSDDVEFTEENALMTAVSGDDGSFTFENLPYGSWYIREIKQPTGFVLDETVYDVNISENEQVVEIEIVNKLVRGNIALTKVDAEYTDTTLTGAVFEVYKDSNDNGELDSEDELLGTLTEKEIGQYEMNDLLYGRFFVKESKAPEGFTLDEGVYEVFIDTDGKTYQVENTEGRGFANEPMRGNLKIVKTSSDGKVEGFAFRITGANGYDVTLETDENGEIFLEGLRIGEYKISEVNNSASAMYILPADKEAAVQTGSTTVVEMHNELRDTPKTGDDSKLGLWLVLAGVSAAGIAACGILGFKRKKKKEDN